MMTPTDSLLLVSASAALSALCLMLGLRLISAKRFGQALGGMAVGLAFARYSLSAAGGGHG